ncbi:hypothetical protein NDU88_003149, partial [Pleurodeles waltl]
QMPLQKKPSGHIRRGTAAATVWQLDYIGPLPKEGGKSYVLTMVDTYSGLMLGMPCKSADQKSTLQGLNYLIKHYGVPDEIQTDRGTHFSGKT